MLLNIPLCTGQFPKTKIKTYNVRSAKAEKPFFSLNILPIFPLLKHWPSGSHVNTFSKGSSIVPAGMQAEVLPHLLCTQVLEPILVSQAAEDSGKGRASISHCSITCSLSFQHTHILQIQTSPAPKTALLEMAFKKCLFFFSPRAPIHTEGFALLKGPQIGCGPLTTTTKECRISQGSEPVGRDLCALKALTPVPRLWLRSPAPRSPASKTTRARVAEHPAGRRVPTPCPPRGGRGIRRGACRRRPDRSAPVRLPRPARVPSRPGAAWASTGAGPRTPAARPGKLRPAAAYPIRRRRRPPPHLDAGGPGAAPSGRAAAARR